MIVFKRSDIYIRQPSSIIFFYHLSPFLALGWLALDYLLFSFSLIRFPPSYPLRFFYRIGAHITMDLFFFSLSFLYLLTNIHQTLFFLHSLYYSVPLVSFHLPVHIYYISYGKLVYSMFFIIIIDYLFSRYQTSFELCKFLFLSNSKNIALTI